MERQFFPPFSPFVPGPFFPGPFFGAPFFPRPFVPFFFLSPFRRRFFRAEGEHVEIYHTMHQCTETETLTIIAQKYNVPVEILAEVNQHIQNPTYIPPGTQVGIPRLYDLHVQRMYVEQEQ